LTVTFNQFKGLDHLKMRIM